MFDNDGTLWSEKPIPIQLDFALHRMAAMAEADPSLQDQQPWKAAFEKDMKWLGEAMVKHYHGDDGDLGLLMAAVPRTIADLSIDDYHREVTTFFEEAEHPVLKRPYRSCGYAPMVELLRYLEENGFTPYIASGGDRDFMRPIASHIYGIPPERIIGSSQALDFQEREDGNDVLYKSEMEFFDDGPTKPVRIWSRIGRRPIVAGGNSNGDIQMLRFANHPGHPALRTLLSPRRCRAGIRLHGRRRGCPGQGGGQGLDRDQHQGRLGEGVRLTAIGSKPKSDWAGVHPRLGLAAKLRPGLARAPTCWPVPPRPR